MKCPECKRAARCADTRESDDGVRKRRYHCSCGFRFGTLEEIIKHGSAQTRITSLHDRQRADRLRARILAALAAEE